MASLIKSTCFEFINPVAFCKNNSPDCPFAPPIYKSSFPSLLTSPTAIFGPSVETLNGINDSRLKSKY